MNRNVSPYLTILIEDCVHRIINPSKIYFLKPNHFVIDSLRKVVPLQGSSLYGRQEDLGFPPPDPTQSIEYSVKVHFYWLLMLICWQAGLSKAAERLMLKGYDLIGDSNKPARGFGIFNFLSDRINFGLVEKNKKAQAEFYESHLKQLPVMYKLKDKAMLRGWPVLLNNKSRKILTRLRNSGMILRFELNDSVWSRKNKIIYLPMGLHIDEKKQAKICKIFSEVVSDIV